MKHLKKFNQLVNERFIVSLSLSTSERNNLESRWGVTIEDIEDVLLELADLSALRGDCTIKTPTNKLIVMDPEDNKIVVVPELIILANIKVSKEEYESIISTIKNRLSQMGLEVEDNTMEHERTKVELGIYFVNLRLMLKSDAQLLNSGSKSVTK